MAQQDPEDPTQPSFLDLVRAMAWAPPNLPLFSGLPAMNGGTPDGTNPGANALGATSTPQWPSPANFVQSVRYAPPFGGIDRAAGPGPQSAANTGGRQFGGPPPAALPLNPPLPRRRPPNAPQVPPIGMSQTTPWSPQLSGFTQPSAPPAFDARWSGAPPPSSLLDMNYIPSPISRQPPKLSAAGTVDPRYIFSSLLDRGFSIPQAAAVVGNMMRESNLDPARVNTKEDAHGLLQWRLDRWQNLQRFAAARGTSPDDVNTQLDFMAHEMRGSEASNVRDFLVTDDVQSANAALKRYVRYGDDSESVRLGYALNVLGLPWTNRR